MRDPSVSVPSANGVRPALTAIAEPEDEPSGFWISVRAVMSNVESAYTVSSKRVIVPYAASNIGRLTLTSYG